jgi:hypothetical protein
VLVASGGIAFVDECAEEFTTGDGWDETEGAARPSLVVVAPVDAGHGLETTAAEQEA